MRVLIDLKAILISMYRSTGCVCFREPGRCAAFNVMLAVLGICALEDFFSSALLWNSCCGAEKESGKITCPWPCISPCLRLADVLGVWGSKEVQVEEMICASHHCWKNWQAEPLFHI
jgi:hypothetical protein